MVSVIESGVPLDLKIRAQFGRLVTTSFQRLLETKHLYQNFTIPADAIESAIDEMANPVRRELDAEVRSAFEYYLNGPWDIPHPERAPMAYAVPHPNRNPPPVAHLYTAKLFCRTCDRIEAYNPVYANDILAEAGCRRGGDTVQVFALGYLCQSCKLMPEYFLVKRKGLKLLLSGRTPIETVTVPPHIERRVAKYYSSTLVAFNSGQTLAALFLLRTLIEQYIRGADRNAERMESLMESYMSSLPNDFKCRFPSFSDIYSRLSLAVHSADESDALFEDTVRQINSHFDARRLFQIPDWRP